METRRQMQVAETIKRNFSMVLMQEGGYIYNSVLVTVTSVKMSSDLGIAKIYLSIYNTDNKQEVILLLEGQSTRLRQALANRIKRQVRKIPFIEFYLDDTLDEMEKVGALIDKLKEDKQMGEEE